MAIRKVQQRNSLELFDLYIYFNMGNECKCISNIDDET